MKKKVEKKETKFDWSRADAMTDEEIHAAALADPDAQPWTEEQLRNTKPLPRVFSLRRALRLSQEEFAAKFHIPLGTLRDWEQGRKEPDAAGRAYLKVIASDPEVVLKALGGKITVPVSDPKAA
ncbi:MAG TPA: helix-turn-helix domain-containing protein [Rhizomicrobium sp.]|jgi:putative transcriptional regulator